MQGGYAGNALGFKLSSLEKLSETRANKPRMSLLHYLVDEAVKENKSVLSFVDKMADVMQASVR